MTRRGYEQALTFGLYWRLRPKMVRRATTSRCQGRRFALPGADRPCALIPLTESRAGPIYRHS